ncbi:General transcriptional corepressor trfA, partial [Ophiophagus hannah]
MTHRREINKENKKKGRWFGPESNCSEKPAGSAVQASKESCFGGTQKSPEKEQGGPKLKETPSNPLFAKYSGLRKSNKQANLTGWLRFTHQAGARNNLAPFYPSRDLEPQQRQPKTGFYGADFHQLSMKSKTGPGTLVYAPNPSSRLKSQTSIVEIAQPKMPSQHRLSSTVSGRQVEEGSGAQRRKTEGEGGRRRDGEKEGKREKERGREGRKEGRRERK